MTHNLQSEEYPRYSRQINLPGIGARGQNLLKEASVLIVGLGGLGSSASYYLAAAGVGRLGLIDNDTVQVTNFNRQILYSTHDIGRLKSQAARERLRAFNPEITIEAYQDTFSDEKGQRIASNYDIIIDATDNFTSKYLISDICVAWGKPDVYGTVSAYEGRVSVFSFDNGPCLRCLFPEPAEAPSDGSPILGTVTGVIGSLQANEAIKIILGIGEILSGRLLTFNAKNTAFTEYYISKNPDCPACG
jgi:adenylyltransferase/sulfurtransferase